MYPLEAPLHSTITKIPTFFKGRIILVIALSIGIPVLLAISILIVKKFKKSESLAVLASNTSIPDKGGIVK